MSDGERGRQRELTYKIFVYLPNLEELLFLVVVALPKASRKGLQAMILSSMQTSRILDLRPRFFSKRTVCS